MHSKLKLQLNFKQKIGLICNPFRSVSNAETLQTRASSGWKFLVRQLSMHFTWIWAFRGMHLTRNHCIYECDFQRQYLIHGFNF